MDALLDALDEYTSMANEVCTENKTGTQCDFGCYSGKISIMGLGGSHKIMGNFAPTTKCTKDDACVQVGIGQSRLNPINIKLDDLACSNQVTAVFLNERYYHELSDKNLTQQNVMNTVRFLGYYEFFESKFVTGDTHDDIQKEFENPPDSVWQYLTFRLHPHLRIEAKPFIDNFVEIQQLMGKNETQYTSLIINHDDHEDIAYDIVDIGGWMTYNHSLTIQDLITAMIDNGKVENLCTHIQSPCTEEYERDMDEIVGEENYCHNDSNAYAYSEYEHFDDSEILKKSNSSGTKCTIDDVVQCCVINAICCALRYNKHCLREYRQTLCAAPLTDEFLGIAHRIRPTLSPNRALDVNLCFLRIAFLEHKSITSSIKAYARCDVTTLHNETLSEMMYQIILLRFTGRICRFEEYLLFQKQFNSAGEACRLLPLRKDTSSFLEYMEFRQEKHKGRNGMLTLTGWISRQHDGVIPSDLKANLYKFKQFLSYVSEHVCLSVRKLRKTKKIHRSSCVEEIQSLLQAALLYASVKKLGNMSWIAHSAIADLEEFLIDPFGLVCPSSVRKGPYSVNGWEMINNGLSSKMEFETCLESLVHHVVYETNDDKLQILGYEKKVDGLVTNLVNGRAFNSTDAEHFLCKAWLNAKITFGNYRVIQFPKQCNSFTHPSPVLHRLENGISAKIMATMEGAYKKYRNEPHT
jgi:hypothetical protein